MTESPSPSSLPFLDYLSTLDFSPQQHATHSLLTTLALPLPTTLTLRPMLPNDINPAAHLLLHTFGDHGLLNKALGMGVPGNAVNNWIARLRVMLCDQVAFLVEDSNGAGDHGVCECAQHTTEDLSNPNNIVAVIMGFDLASRVFSLPLPPPTHPRLGAIREFLGMLGKGRMARIREEDNLLLTQEEVKERAEKAAAAEGSEKAIHPEKKHHFLIERDDSRDNSRTVPKSGEGLELWLLGTKKSHTRHHLASIMSKFFLEYVKQETKFEYITLEAVHPATEKIWTKLGAKVMYRAKTSEFELNEENGTCFPFTGVTYDMCSLDIILKKTP